MYLKNILILYMNFFFFFYTKKNYHIFLFLAANIPFRHSSEQTINGENDNK